MEAAFVKSLSVVNEDGTVPSHTWAIDDDSVADQAIDDFGALVEDCGLLAELCKAKEEFRTAEEQLARNIRSINDIIRDETLDKRTRANALRSVVNIIIYNKAEDTLSVEFYI